MHFKPIVSLQDEFALYAKVARELASRLPHGPERTDLMCRARRADATSCLEDQVKRIKRSTPRLSLDKPGFA
jgi:hypothetical protein